MFWLQMLNLIVLTVTTHTPTTWDTLYQDWLAMSQHPLKLISLTIAIYGFWKKGGTNVHINNDSSIDNISNIKN